MAGSGSVVPLDSRSIDSDQRAAAATGIEASSVNSSGDSWEKPGEGWPQMRDQVPLDALDSQSAYGAGSQNYAFFKYKLK